MFKVKVELEIVVILTDSLSTPQKFRSDRDDEQFRNLKREMATLTARSVTVLQWIPARVGIPVNERADRMAKGRQQPTTDQQRQFLQRSKDCCETGSSLSGLP